MAQALKDFFDEAVVRGIAGGLRGAFSEFDEPAFIAECCAGLQQLELTERGWHLAEAMHRHLPADFPHAARILVQALGPELESSESFGMEPFRYLPHVFFVGKYGLDHFEEAMQAQYELTKRMSCEWSIRPYLERHPDATLARLAQWAEDANVHVRRLVSEGTRPRLPWAPRLRAFQQDPAPVLKLLERLKDDPERYVQRSVANNLNDISKDHPERVVAICSRWRKNAPPGRHWLIRHGLRTLIKRGDAGALKLLGFGGAPQVMIGDIGLRPNPVKLGGILRFSVELRSTSKQAQSLLVDYAVHFVKSNGSLRPKVFKLRMVQLSGGETAQLEGRVSFAPMTTRTSYPGTHRLELCVNGTPFPLADFDVRT